MGIEGSRSSTFPVPAVSQYGVTLVRAASWCECDSSNQKAGAFAGRSEHFGQAGQVHSIIKPGLLELETIF